MRKDEVRIEDVRLFHKGGTEPKCPMLAIGVWQDTRDGEHYLYTRSVNGQIYRVPIVDPESVATFDTSGLVPVTTQVVAGANLTGGGALSANVTLNAINQRRVAYQFGRAGFFTKQWLNVHSGISSDATFGAMPVSAGSVVKVGLCCQCSLFSASNQVTAQVYVNGAAVTAKAQVTVTGTSVFKATFSQAAGVDVISASDTVAVDFDPNGAGTFSRVHVTVECEVDS